MKSIEVGEPVTELHADYRRFAHWYGIGDMSYGRMLHWTSGEELIDPRVITVPPAHFGYASHETVGESYEEDTYLLVGDRNRVICHEIQPILAEVWFSDGDFERLEGDHTVSRVYSSGGLDMWRIKA